MRLRHAALLLLVAPALATAQDRSATSNEQSDRKGDAKGGFDIVRVAAARARDGRLRAEMTLAEAWTAADLRKAGPGAALCIRIFTRRDPNSEPPDYLLCITAPKEGDELVGRLLRDRSNGLPRRVADVVVTRPTGRTAYLRFTRSSIGKPAELRYSGESTSHAEGCPEPGGCRDFAPAAPRSGYLALR